MNNHTLVIVVCLCPATASAQSYEIIDLGDLDIFQEVETQGVALNERGSVTGTTMVFRAFDRAFLLPHNQAMIDLGALQQDCYFLPCESWGLGVNNHGDVVGKSEKEGTRHHAFLWRRGALVDLGTLYAHHNVSAANAINDLGYVVGTSEDHESVGFIFFDGDDDLRRDEDEMAAIPDSVVLNAINNLNQIAGRSRRGATYWSPVGEDWELFSIGSLADWEHGFGEAFAINDLGYVVGEADTEISIRSPRHAFLFHDDNDNGVRDDGEMIDLGTLGGDSIALDINNANQVVGRTTTSAFLWQNGQMRDLNDHLAGSSGWYLYGASGINDAGMITGWGMRDGVLAIRGFLMIPCADRDDDLICDSTDNCPDHVNPMQGDCDDNGIGDICELASGRQQDCNENDIPDNCDLDDGTSLDHNDNGIPDECEDVLVLGLVSPAVAGVSNQVTVYNATPDSRVHVIYGVNAGQVEVPNCPGTSVLMAAPQLVGSAVADQVGRAVIQVFIPTDKRGHYRVQAVEKSMCRVSEADHVRID